MARGVARPLALALAAATLLAACGGGDGGSDAGAPPPTPTAPPPPTSSPSPTPTTPPAPTASPTPAPAATPEPSPAAPLEGLWAGPLGSLWLAFRLTPGEDPETDAWLIESGPLGPPDLRCPPQRRPDGWLLERCVGSTPGTSTSIFAPLDGSRLEVALARPGPAGAVRTQAVLTKIAQRDEPASANVSLVWSHRSRARGAYSDIWVAEGVVFAARLSGVVELLDARSGELLGLVNLRTAPPAAGGALSPAWDVKAHEGVLYVATGAQGLLIYDVSDPSAPALLGQHVTTGADAFISLHNIFLSPAGDVVYAINTSSSAADLRLIDVSDPASPREVGRFRAPGAGGVHDINVEQRDGRLIAYLNYLQGGLHILDVTDPSRVELLGSIAWAGGFSHSGWPFAAGGRRYYAHTDEGYDRGVTVIDVTDPADPAVVARVQTRPGPSVHNVEVVDGLAYVSYYIDGLRVFDLRDPANPRELAHFDTVPEGEERALTQGAWGVKVYDGLVYISDIEGGIFAFRVDVD